MKNLYLVFAAIFSFCMGYSQGTLHYDFTSSLEEVNGNGPVLSVLGDAGIYVEDTLLEIGSAEKWVYRFEPNSGFQFDNAAAGNFLGESYTIELYFVFDYLNSWKRVVDWKNRKSDNGAYVYNGQLNFYPYQYSGEAPVNAGEYTYYVVTRDASDEEVIVYTDAVTQISFIDSGGDALLDEDNVLNFFHDDLVVPNEVSSGAVAMLKIYNTVLDSATIKANFEDLAGNVFSVSEFEGGNSSLRVYPNPATDKITVDLSDFGSNQNVSLKLITSQGKIVEQYDVIPASDMKFTFGVGELNSGIYALTAESRSKIISQKVLIQD